MSSKSRWAVFLISTPLVALVAIGGLLGASTEPPQRNDNNLVVFRDVLGLVIQNYVEPVDIDKVFEGAMRGLAEGMDSASAYLTPDEVKAIDTTTPMPPADVGLVVTRQFYLKVVGVRDGSAAAKAGIQTGDFLRMIDGKPTRDMSAVTGMRLLRGAAGSKVNVVVIRGNPADPHPIDLVRAVPTGGISSSTLPGGFARVRVTSFVPDAAATLKSTFDALSKQKVAGAVIDLRGTADGDLETGIAAAKLFLKSGTVGIRAGRKTEKVVTTAGAGDGVITMPVVLLVSNGTANAAEVFAAALSGNDRAELVGEPTAGIAARQKLIRLPENYGLWMTYERYLKVDGKEPIHERGLRPTVGVEMPVVGFDEVPPATDEPLSKATEVLKKAKGTGA
jgi:carboxyl-terminal processing protease